MRRGFTLIELLISLALIGVVTVSAIPIYREVQSRNDLDIAANTVAQTLRRAQILAQGMDEDINGDASWGVNMATGAVTLFRGASFAGHDASFDEVFEVSSTITPSGLTEVVFTKFTGAPAATGTTTLTGVNSETRTLTINAKGTIIY